MSGDDYMAADAADQTGNTGSTARSRRGVLKMGAAVIASSAAVPKVAKSQPVPEEIYQQGLEIRRRTGSHKAFEKHITNNDFRVEMRGASQLAPRTSTGIRQIYNPGGIRPDQDQQTGNKGEEGTGWWGIEPNDITLWCSVYTHPSGDTSFIKAWWKIFDNGTDWVPSPEDIINIKWGDHTDYDLKDDSWNSDRFTWKEKFNPNGILFRHHSSSINSRRGHSHYGDTPDDPLVWGQHLEVEDEDNVRAKGWASVQAKPTAPIRNRQVMASYYPVAGTIGSPGAFLTTNGAVTFGATWDTDVWNSPVQVLVSDTREGKAVVRADSGDWRYRLRSFSKETEKSFWERVTDREPLRDIEPKDRELTRKYPGGAELTTVGSVSGGGYDSWSYRGFIGQLSVRNPEGNEMRFATGPDGISVVAIIDGKYAGGDFDYTIRVSGSIEKESFDVNEENDVIRDGSISGHVIGEYEPDKYPEGDYRCVDQYTHTGRVTRIEVDDNFSVTFVE